MKPFDLPHFLSLSPILNELQLTAVSLWISLIGRHACNFYCCLFLVKTDVNRSTHTTVYRRYSSDVRNDNYLNLKFFSTT